ncbi:hypothetical protein Lalb_Chr23g0275511 [Lupinus albus]|uniref:Uncharacterized protein n=1 Tax=Lupinus albus TaxID=3870 RepID=A0A6A4NDR8_LUPAL|nr:hypothetical protein Lalb_Chr23g0275511 [Lupinus albus]
MSCECVKMNKGMFVTMNVLYVIYGDKIMRCLVLIVYDMDVSVMGNSTCPMWYGDYSTCPMWYEDYLYGAKLLNEIKGKLLQNVKDVKSV